MQNFNDNVFYIKLDNLRLYISYVTRSDQNNRAILVLLQDLLRKINPYTTYGEDHKLIETFKFLQGLVAARLNKIRDRDLLIIFATKGLNQDLLNFSDLDRSLTVNELNFIAQNIADTYDNFNALVAMGGLNDSLTQYNISSTKSEKDKILTNAKNSLDKFVKESRKTNIAANSEFFSLDDSVYSRTVANVYDRNCNPSTKLRTGMVAFNKSLAGGFENGRVYVYLGLPGEGKSTTLLNLALQIKNNNTTYETKDPTKEPCVLFLTMENSLEETIERIFNITVSEGDMSQYGSYEEVLGLLKSRGLEVSDNNPINLIIQYVPANTVSTDYLYTLYDDLLDQGKECICVIQDYIKRIKCRDFNVLKGDMRLGLGAVIDEFKEFAIEKQVPVITASQMNREATNKVDENRKADKADLVRNLGRSNIGESMLILENADAVFIITPEYNKYNRKYLGVTKIKTRFKGSTISTFFHPYNNDRHIELEEDIFLTDPLYKDTLITKNDMSNKNAYQASNITELSASGEEEIKVNEEKAKKVQEILEKAKAKKDNNAGAEIKEEFDGSKTVAEQLRENHIIQRQLNTFWVQQNTMRPMMNVVCKSPERKKVNVVCKINVK